MQKFNRTNFVKSLGHILQVDTSVLRKEVRDYIWPRLDFLKTKKNRGDRFFLVEENYVETEWKDMISVHYINTSYHVENTVIRVHLFMTQQIENESYLGFFTLRKIDETRIMLSFIYPNWPKTFYEEQQLYVMTYKKSVHINGKELSFYTYPLFVQDNITVACAQVCMISMSKYLHNKYDYNQIRISEIESAFSSNKTKAFPSFGLRPTQMLEIFNYYNIPIQYKVFNNIEDNYSKFREYIDYSVESAIPVIIGIVLEHNKRHVIQIIGHTQQQREQYVFYDDSGFLLKNLGRDGFVGAIEWKYLKKYIIPDKSFIIYPLHEKVYIFYEDFKILFLNMFYGIEQYRQLIEEKVCFIDQTRFLLADNRQVKAFLRKIVTGKIFADLKVKEEAEKLLTVNMPHYIWCSQVPVRDTYFLFLADPTYSKMTTKRIFLNKIPIACNEIFGLLKYE